MSPDSERGREKRARKRRSSPDLTRPTLESNIGTKIDRTAGRATIRRCHNSDFARRPSIFSTNPKLIRAEVIRLQSAR
jgi:hypothetical protein